MNVYKVAGARPQFSDFDVHKRLVFLDDIDRWVGPRISADGEE